tara:strand:+ start:3064 stop:3909 length:846 start_codon:yes stop_codon:yes gene_type:complete
MALSTGAQALGRALGGLGSGGEKGKQVTGFGLGTGDYQKFAPAYGIDSMMIDPRFQLWQASEGAGRLGSLAANRLERPFSVGDPVQQSPVMTGPFTYGTPIGVRATDPAIWDPRGHLRSQGMSAGDPFQTWSKRFEGNFPKFDDAGEIKLDEAGKQVNWPAADPGDYGEFAHPGGGTPDPYETMKTSMPDLQQMDGALEMMGIKRDKVSGRYSAGDFMNPAAFEQDLFVGSQGGQHRIPGSSQRPFGEGAESARVGSQGLTGAPAGPGGDVRRRRTRETSV